MMMMMNYLYCKSIENGHYSLQTLFFYPEEHYVREMLFLDSIYYFLITYIVKV